MKVEKIHWKEYDPETDENTIDHFERFSFTNNAVKNFEMKSGGKSLVKVTDEIFNGIKQLGASTDTKDPVEAQKLLQATHGVIELLRQAFSALWVKRDGVTVSQEYEDLEEAYNSDWMNEIAKIENVQLLNEIIGFRR